MTSNTPNATTTAPKNLGRINDMEDPTGSIECLCPSSRGYFFPADKNGFIVWEDAPADIPIRPWPAAEDMHALCPECGNLFSEALLLESKVSTVSPVNVVDFNDEAHRQNRIAYENM